MNRPCGCPATHLHHGRTRGCFDCGKCLMGKVRDQNVRTAVRHSRPSGLVAAVSKKLVLPK